MATRVPGLGYSSGRTLWASLRAVISANRLWSMSSMPCLPTARDDPRLAVFAAVRNGPHGPRGAGLSQRKLRTASDPLFAALVELLLPERHLLLERVDRVLARSKGILPVRRRHGDDHARFA